MFFEPYPWPWNHVRWYPCERGVFRIGHPPSAQRCPVCDGRGHIEGGHPSSTATESKPCHGCDGKGWVKV